MKKLKALPALMLAANLLFLPSMHAAEVIERIVAVVNDEIITDRDLDLIMAPVTAQYRTIYTGGELDARMRAARQEFLNKLIEEKLILSEAKRRQVILKDAEVDEMMTEVRTKFPTRELFLKALEDQGLTEKKLWNRFRDQIMTQKYMNYEVRSKISVSPGEISEYYKAHEGEFEQGRRVKLLQILVREGARSDEEAKQFADSLVSQLESGKSFDELAKAYSEGTEAAEGGSMGWVEKGQLLGEIDDKIFELEEGQTTAPIKSALGYHIFKVIEKQDSAVKPIADVRSEIHDVLFKEKVKKKLDSFIGNLRKNAYISIRS